MVALLVAGCSSTQRGAGFGAATGAIIGGVTTGTVQGAAVGAAVGTVTGAVAGRLLGKSRADPEMCVYEDRRGNEFVDVCPKG